jgi:hypothetical protein
VNEVAIKKRLEELVKAMAGMPPAGPAGRNDNGIYYSETYKGKKGSPVEESLDHLRLHVKYLVFDLEATRRENRYLRQMLNNRRRPNPGDADDKLSGP